MATGHGCRTADHTTSRPGLNSAQSSGYEGPFGFTLEAANPPQNPHSVSPGRCGFFFAGCLSRRPSAAKVSSCISEGQ